MSLSLAYNVIVARADNHPPMFDKTQYSSWASRMLLYIKGKENDKLLVDSVLNGPFKYGTVIVPGTQTTPETVKDRRYDELKDAKKFVKPERESKLYDEFDMFTLVPGETIHSYYLRFTQLINNMHTIGMTMRPIQVNTKFINHLQPEWRKFVMNVKLANDLNNTNFDQLYAYLRQHDAHADEVHIMKERFLNPLALVANTCNASPSYSNQTKGVFIFCLKIREPIANHSSLVHHQSYQAHDVHQPSQASFPLMDSGLVVPLFLPSDDPIASLNKAMVFISTTFTSRYTPTNNQLRISSNPRNQENIQDGRVQVQTVQRRQNQGERQYTKPKRPRNLVWFKKKAMLFEALKSRVILDEEHTAFLADNRDTVITGQQSQEIPIPLTFQTNDLDAFDFNCDEAPSASVVLMAKLFSYDSTPLSEEHAAVSVINIEETLKLAEESRLKMHAKQNDLVVQEKKVNIAPIDYVALNKLFDHFVKHFVPQKEAHVDYLKYTQEHVDTLYEIVEHDRALRPLDSDLDSACKFATRVLELLVYV
nr:hypothetical protein [Tanacetum cinerariifolium]